MRVVDEGNISSSTSQIHSISSAEHELDQDKETQACTWSVNCEEQNVVVMLQVFEPTLEYTSSMLFAVLYTPIMLIRCLFQRPKGGCEHFQYSDASAGNFWADTVARDGGHTTDGFESCRRHAKMTASSDRLAIEWGCALILSPAPCSLE